MRKEKKLNRIYEIIKATYALALLISNIVYIRNLLLGVDIRLINNVISIIINFPLLLMNMSDEVSILDNHPKLPLINCYYIYSFINIIAIVVFTIKYF